MGTDPLETIIDDAVDFVSRKVARLELHRKNSSVPDPQNPTELSVSVDGDYQMLLELLAGQRFLHAVAENMKRGAPDDETELKEYVVEYFNILCGRVISAYNRQSHLSARFGIPRFGNPAQAVTQKRELAFDSGYGVMKLIYSAPFYPPDC